MTVLDERFIRKAVINWLSRKGYNRYLNEKETAEHGVDIKVRHYRYTRYFLVEVKGEPDPKTHKWPDSAREASFNYVLGQILTRMKHQALYWYGIALPESLHDKINRRLPWVVCKKLRLVVFLVNKQGKVREINWKELKRLQKK